jgi:hypothetical protein
MDPASYADVEGFTPRIRPRDLTEQLRCGATLSFEAIDELHQPLTELAEAFESCFHAGTKINIYAGWRALHGLDLHRDDQEIFILQLDGRKRWLLYGFNVDSVDRSELNSTSTPPPGAVFEEVLSSGDLLYIPRGCYHLAVPMNEPTLHLTISVKNPREIDLLEWLTERVRATGAADRDLPCVAGPEERERFSESFKKTLLEGLDADLVQQYLAEAGSNIPPRPSFTLPWSATPERLPRGHDFFIRSNLDPQSIANANGSVALRYRGHTYKFPHAMRWILEQLKYEAAVPMDRLIERVADRLDEETVRLLVSMLVKQSLVTIGV